MRGNPDPALVPDKKPMAFDAQHPFAHLGLRKVHAGPGERPRTAVVRCEEVELSLAERSGTEGFAQWLRPSSLGERSRP